MKFKWKGLKLNAFVDGEIEAENKEEAMNVSAIAGRLNRIKEELIKIKENL